MRVRACADVWVGVRARAYVRVRVCACVLERAHWGGNTQNSVCNNAMHVLRKSVCVRARLCTAAQQSHACMRQGQSQVELIS